MKVQRNLNNYKHKIDAFHAPWVLFFSPFCSLDKWRLGYLQIFLVPADIKWPPYVEMQVIEKFLLETVRETRRTGT